jgi:hypothetical protein
MHVLLNGFEWKANYSIICYSGGIQISNRKTFATVSLRPLPHPPIQMGPESSAAKAPLPAHDFQIFLVASKMRPSAANAPLPSHNFKFFQIQMTFCPIFPIRIKIQKLVE